MNKEDLKNLIRKCVNEVKLENKLKSLIKESLEAIKITKQDSLAEKMKDLADAVKKIKSDADVTLDDAKRYNVCYCHPHHFSIYPMTDDNFTVTYFKDGSDRTKKFNLTFEELKKYVTETLKENVGDYVQKAYNKAAENSKDKESKKEEGPQETDEKVVDQVENKKDLPDSKMQSVDKIKKQVDHSLKGEKASYKYPKQTDKKLTVKQKTFKGKSNKKK